MSKYGKKSTYIDSNNFLQEADEKNFSSESTYSEIPDTIRYYSKNYWTVFNNSEVLANKIDNRNILFSIDYNDDSSITLVANKQKFLNRIINEKGILEEKFDSKKWEEFIVNILPDKNVIFEDSYVKFNEPINLTELSAIESNINYINREFKYGFYSQKYENLSGDYTLDVSTLPGIYSILNDKKLDSRTYEENLTLTLGGLIPDDYAESLFLATDYNNNVKKYFEIFSDTYNTPEARTAINQILIENYNTSIDKNKLDLARKIKFIPFPYYIDVVFSNVANETSNLIHFINNTGNISSDLIKHLRDSSENIFNKDFINIKNTLEKKTIKWHDFKYWIDRELAGTPNEGTADGVRIYNENSRAYSQVEYVKLIEHIKNNIRPTIRKYSEYTTKESQNSLLLYKIEKKQLNNNSPPIQTFWITPDNGDAIRFIDTQIKYGTNYYYSMTGYTFVVSNKYSYEDSAYHNTLDKIKDIENGKYKINVKNSPSYKIVELNVADINGIVHEFPCTKPQIKIEKDTENIRINLLQSDLKSLEKFEIIENKDFNLFQSIMKSQDNIEEEKIESVLNNGNTVGLQIYKTIIKPINYLSFQGKLYKTLTINNEKSFIDSLVANTKYWYLFRYLNNHNTPSNVSKIFEVEMKNEDGYTYLNVSELDLNKSAEKTYEKNMKRYLLIRPSVIQTQPKSGEVVNSIDDIYLGPPASSVWNKDFILRIKSKKSNRILEFNLKSIINRKKE